MSVGPTDPLYVRRRGHEDDPRPISAVLSDLAFGWPQERIALGDIVDGLADRGFAILMLLLALPTTLPIAPPGLSAAFGLPLAAIALQLAIGAERPWLPKVALRRSFLTSDFRSMINRAMPLLKRLERVLMPRLPFLTGWVQERLIGAVCTVLGLLLASPVPLTNVPLSFAIVFLALGLLARDGLALIVGLASAIGAGFFLFYMSAAAWTAIESAIQAWF
jgi:hypothetical protein